MANYSWKRGKLNTYAVRVAVRFFGKTEEDVQAQVKEFKKLFPTTDTKGAVASALQWLYEHEHHDLPKQEHILTEAYKAQVKYPGWESIKPKVTMREELDEGMRRSFKQRILQNDPTVVQDLEETVGKMQAVLGALGELGIGGPPPSKEDDDDEDENDRPPRRKPRKH